MCCCHDDKMQQWSLASARRRNQRKNLTEAAAVWRHMFYLFSATVVPTALHHRHTYTNTHSASLHLHASTAIFFIAPKFSPPPPLSLTHSSLSLSCCVLPYLQMSLQLRSLFPPQLLSKLHLNIANAFCRNKLSVSPRISALLSKASAKVELGSSDSSLASSHIELSRKPLRSEKQQDLQPFVYHY